MMIVHILLMRGIDVKSTRESATNVLNIQTVQRRIFRGVIRSSFHTPARNVLVMSTVIILKGSRIVEVHNVELVFIIRIAKIQLSQNVIPTTSVSAVKHMRTVHIFLNQPTVQAKMSASNAQTILIVEILQKVRLLYVLIISCVKDVRMMKSVAVNCIVAMMDLAKNAFLMIIALLIFLFVEMIMNAKNVSMILNVTRIAIVMWSQGPVRTAC